MSIIWISLYRYMVVRITPHPTEIIYNGLDKITPFKVLFQVECRPVDTNNTHFISSGNSIFIMSESEIKNELYWK